MIEFDVDMNYLLECGELDKVVLNDENGEHGPMEFMPIAATANSRSCASCPEMDNPDSYISHIHRALKWHDEHVPIPTNTIGTCVVLQGKKPPEEVLFVRDEGGVTHYLPERTCSLVAKTEKDGRKRGGVRLLSINCDVCGEPHSGAWHEYADGTRVVLRDKKDVYCSRCGCLIMNEVSE